MRNNTLLTLGVLGLVLAQPARGQEAQEADPSAVEVPVLAFTPTPSIERDYDKYFYYHRADTDFATALADLRECDAYARGISLSADGGPTGPLAGVVADAIFGAAQRRDISRRNRRVCMGFKDYRRYGLPKSIWEQVNPQEEAGETGEARRQRRLRIQARIASGPKPNEGTMVR